MWSIVLKDNLKACIPYKQSLRQLVRRIRPYRSLADNDDLAFNEGLRLIGFIKNENICLDQVLEVGTGWIPTIPQMLKACGAGKIILTDIERLCDPATFRYACDRARSRIGEISSVSGIGHHDLEKNIMRDGIEEYRCPPDLANIPSNSINLIYSRTVLEHIHRNLLVKLFLQWKRILLPGGYCIHFIDNSDHFAHRCDGLSRLNFLRYSQGVWKIACLNPQNFHNRLRHSDYVRMFREAGFVLLHVEGRPDARALADLDHLVTDRVFAGYDREDLAVLKTVIVARKPPGPEEAGR